MHYIKEVLYRRVKKKVEMMGVRDWKKRFESERGKKGVPEVVKYADESVGARVRMLYRGGCLPVRPVNV